MKTWALFGASRGLGYQFGSLLQDQLILFSRKKPLLRGQWYQADFSKPHDQDRVLEVLKQFSSLHAVYFAGGGPYGNFEKPEWKDHRWAFETSFLFAARLTHFLIRHKAQSLTFIGSSVAEDCGDPRALSYAASKAALKSLFLTLAQEKPPLDIKLFSPGYMDTDLLPPHAAPRKQQIWDPKEVAKELYEFITKEPAFSQRRFAPYPT